MRSIQKGKMTILEFIESFPDEASCRSHWKAHRESVSIVCKTCGCEKHYWLSNKAQCRFQTQESLPV